MRMDKPQVAAELVGYAFHQHIIAAPPAGYAPNLNQNYAVLVSFISKTSMIITC
jgi:hypothetical protein